MTDGYQDALRALEDRGSGPDPGSAEAKRALERFGELFSDLSESRIRAQIGDVYAKDVYFNDTLKEVQGLDTLTEYMVESARAVESCHVQLDDVAANEGNFYVRWRMEIRFRQFRKGAITTSIGMSHLRLNENGKIALHQDYWDAASGLFEHFPLLGYAIRAIKSRL